MANAVQQTELFKDQASINKLVETNPSLSQKVFTMLNNIKNKLSNDSEYYKSINKLTDNYVKAINELKNKDIKSDILYYLSNKGFKTYTEEDYKRIVTKSDSINLASKIEDVIDFYHKCIDKGLSGKRLYLAIIDNELSKRLVLEINNRYDISNYNIGLIADDIRHYNNNHGNDKNEQKRGNIKGITDFELTHLLDLINNFEAASISIEHNNEVKLRLLTKYNNVHYLLLFSVAKSRHTLSLNDIYTIHPSKFNQYYDLYKEEKKNGTLLSTVDYPKTVNATSETSRRAGSKFKITQDLENVNNTSNEDCVKWMWERKEKRKR